MNLEDLRAVRSRERASDGLQDLRDSFYEEVADYIESRKTERERVAEQADDPFGSEEVQALTDEIETAEQVAEAVYERRMGKLVKQASLAAAGMAGNTDGLTSEERRLYDDLVARIEENKEHVLDVLAGEATTEPAESADSEKSVPDPADSIDSQNPEPDADPVPDPDAADSPSVRESSAAAAMGGDLPDETSEPGDSTDEPTEAAAAEDETDRTTVRITQDVGEIFGVDERQYTLEADDVVTLPEENAHPLVEKEAAEELQ